MLNKGRVCLSRCGLTKKVSVYAFEDKTKHFYSKMTLTPSILLSVLVLS